MNKKQFNIEEWLNKKPQETTATSMSVDCCPLSVDTKKSVQIREIRGDKNMIRVNSCQFVDQQKYVQIPAIRGDKKSIETWFSPTIQSHLTQVSKIVIPIKRLAQFLASVINNVRRTNRLLQHLLQVV